MTDTTVRSSADWQYHTGVIVYDPDGWDRQNFEASWAEKITLAEFKRRTALSTVDFRSYQNANDFKLW